MFVWKMLYIYCLRLQAVYRDSFASINTKNKIDGETTKQ